MEENKSVLIEDEEFDEIVSELKKESSDEYVIRTTEKKKTKLNIVFESIVSFFFTIIFCILMCISCALLTVLSILVMPFFAIYEIFSRDFFDTLETKKVKKEDII